MRITYVTGPSGSGKTTLHSRLIEAGHSHAIELDDPGEFGEGPNAGHVEFLRWRALEHLHEVTERARDGADEHHIVTGIVWPFHVLDSDAWEEALDADVEVRFVLLDRPWDDVEASMLDRLGPGGEEWDADAVREQLTLNRRQARSLRRQVQAIAHGVVIPHGDLDSALALLATAW